MVREVSITLKEHQRITMGEEGHSAGNVYDKYTREETHIVGRVSE